MPSSSIRSHNLKSKLDQSKQLEKIQKHYELQNICHPNKRPSVLIIIVIVGMIVIYHSVLTFQAFNDQQQKEKQDSIQCLIKFKGSSCNPLTPTDECQSLQKCIQRGQQNIDQIQLLLTIIKEICLSLSQTALGPIAFAILVFILIHIK